MKLSLIPLLLSLLILSSCEPKSERVIESNWSPEQPKIIAFYLEEGSQKFKSGEEKYYESGTMEYAGFFDKDGKRHGEWKYFYQDGTLWSVGNYDHGSKTGAKLVYWPDGKLRYEGFFTNDEKSGHWIFYNLDGSLLQEMDF